MSTSRRPRRSRFTVRLDNGETRVFLGYTEADAGTFYRSKGHKVVWVTKGDLRKQAQVQKTKAEGGFRIDQKAFIQAQQTLGLRMPVKIRYNSRVAVVAGKNGSYSHERTYHSIMLKSYLTPEQATKTLWHELTHAMQAERAGDYAAWLLESSQQHRHYTYQRRPIEIEARAMSAKMAPTNPLCLAR